MDGLDLLSLHRVQVQRQRNGKKVERLQHNMRGGRREKTQPPDYAPRGVQFGNSKKNTSAHKHKHFKHDLQRGGGRGDGGKPVTGCSKPSQLGDGGKPAQTSSHPVLQPRGAGHRPACHTGGTKQAKAWDGVCG